MYAHILKFVSESVWAITEEKMQIINSFLSRKAAGETIPVAEVGELKRTPAEPLMVAAEGEMEAGLQAATSSASRSRAGNVAVLPLYGTISPKANLLSDISGGTSLDKFMSWFRAAQADPNVRSIVIDVDSPGGAVNGVQEAADEIFKSRGNKPVIAQVTGMAASAAYWIASQADQLIVTPSGFVGSIGVYTMIVDDSEAQAKEGIKTEIIKAGKFKAELEETPITQDARDALQEMVNEAYDTFTNAVARGRGVTQSVVKKGYGQGRVLSASKGLAEGMADRVSTMDATLSRMGVKSAAVKPAVKAEDTPAPVVAEEPKDDSLLLKKRLLKLL